MENNQDKIVCSKWDLIFAYPTDNEVSPFALKSKPCENAKVTPFILNKDWTKMKNLLTGEIYELNLDQLSKKAQKQVKADKENESSYGIICRILKHVYGDLNFNYVDDRRNDGFCFKMEKREYPYDRYFTIEDVKTLCDINNEHLSQLRTQAIIEEKRKEFDNASDRAQEF